MTNTHTPLRSSLVLAAALATILVRSAWAQGPAADVLVKLRGLITDTPRPADSVRLHSLFDLWWEYNMREYPEWATYEGYGVANDGWTDLTFEAIDRRREQLQIPRDVIRSIDRARLAPTDQVSYDLFAAGIDDQIAGGRFPEEYLRISQLGGIQQDLPSLMEVAPKLTQRDFLDRVARLRSVGKVIEQTIALLTRGLEKGIVPPRITMEAVPRQILNVIPEDPLKSPLLAPFAEMPSSVDSAEARALRDAAVAAYREEVAPAFTRLHRFVVGRYLPATRATIGLSALPGGADWYAYRVHQSTTTSLTPKEIFDLGMREVKRIRGEMDALIAKIGFKGDLAAFTKFLRTDPRFYYTDSASLLAGYRDICKRADPELIKLFGRLPRLPYGVIPIPSYAEQSQTTAYYQSGALESGRPGYFYANTYDLKSRPKWEMEALALHEAVPGHHLQISLAREMERMPRFRKSGEYTAFVEGWGLYSESLGEEMGFYTDPYAKYGQLTYEMWRAIRLVLDPGIHAMGWTRDQAVAFFSENSSKAPHDIEVEVDRYIAWPGQATAYKIGELKIKELRRWAREQLGDRFDVRAFHDHVLGQGAIPLSVLERQIHEWVRSVSETKP